MRNPYTKDLRRNGAQTLVKALRQGLAEYATELNTVLRLVGQATYPPDFRILHIELQHSGSSLAFEPLARFYTTSFDELDGRPVATWKSPLRKPPYLLRPRRSDRELEVPAIIHNLLLAEDTSDWASRVAEFTMQTFVASIWTAAVGKRYGYPAYISTEDTGVMLNLRSLRWEQVPW